MSDFEYLWVRRENFMMEIFLSFYWGFRYGNFSVEFFEAFEEKFIQKFQFS